MDGDQSTASIRPKGWNGRDRRQGDRREAPTRPLAALLTPKRREDGRRQEDRAFYVDRYTKKESILLFLIFTLNVCDAFFTMLWLDKGGREANPVMEFFLEIGDGAFIAQKCFFVGFWLVILLVHKNFRFARFGLYASLAVYAALLALHFSLIAFDVKPPTDHGGSFESSQRPPTEAVAQRETAPRARP